jgi:SAM-dependent methyltransferase
MPPSTDDHDRFFDDLYERTTAPFVSPLAASREVDSFVALAKPPAGALVLDLGCGSGRHLALLKQHDFKPIGLDRSRVLAREARATGLPVVRADVRAMPLRAAHLDAVACFYSSIFFFDEAGNLEALREVARVLRPGGALVLQTANPVHLRRLGPEETTQELPDGSRVFERAAFDLASGRENGLRRLTLPDGTSTEGRFSIRHYAPGELDVLARRAGMRLERTCGGLDLQPFARTSRELVALLRRT